jgi:hypothetical protein
MQVCQKNRILVAVVASILVAGPSATRADDGEYLSRSDKVLLTTGDAPKANIAIQHPDPWPRYVNRTRIPDDGRRAVEAMERYHDPYLAPPPQTIINVTTSGVAKN